MSSDEMGPTPPARRGPTASLGYAVMVFLVSVAIGVGLTKGGARREGVPAPAVSTSSAVTAPMESGSGATAAPPTGTPSAPAVTTSATGGPGTPSDPALLTGPSKDYPRSGIWQIAQVSGGERNARAVAVVVEQGLPVDPDQVAQTVIATLNDPRGWAGKGHPVRLVSDLKQADLVIHLSTPASTDKYCYPMQTDGIVSCTITRKSIYLNSDRWLKGVPHMPDLGQYKRYLISHEFGHSVGMKHVPCSGKGKPAPVMLQQTLHLNGCVPNEWITVA